jgi:hypothetical protein
MSTRLALIVEEIKRFAEIVFPFRIVCILCVLYVYTVAYWTHQIPVLIEEITVIRGNHIFQL